MTLGVRRKGRMYQPIRARLLVLNERISRMDERLRFLERRRVRLISCRNEVLRRISDDAAR